ncbi:MAG: hypothetical protein CL834_03175 [Crocinitomicaceae bacterium]|nr:hypothetical protein [Crocinitomicaceae bacterium]
MRLLPQFSLFLRILRCAAILLFSCGIVSASIHGQSAHDASCALRSGWDTNPARYTVASGAPMVYWDGAYLGSKAINQQQLHWRVDAFQHKAIGLDFSASNLSGEFKLLRVLNPWMQAWLKTELDQTSDFERHWRKGGQWVLMERSSQSGQVGFSWDVDRESGEILITKRNVKYTTIDGYDRNEFCVEALFRRNIFRRVHGAYKLPLVNPKRIEPAGSLWSRVKYEQRGFGNWFQNGGNANLDIKALSPNHSTVLNAVDLHSPRMWLIFSAQAGYIAPAIHGWNWGVNVQTQRIQDEGERRFDRVDYTGRMWLQMKHAPWRGYAQGEWGQRTLGRSEVQSWSRWNVHSRVGYAISSSAQVLCSFTWSGNDSYFINHDRSFLGDWRGGSVSIGLQWRHAARSKWMPPAEDFNGLFMKRGN